MSENNDILEDHWLCERASAKSDKTILQTIKKTWPYASLTSEDDLDYSDDNIQDYLNSQMPGNMVVVKILNNNRTSTSGFIAECNNDNHDCVVISFRGSKEPKDWIRNFLLIDKNPWLPYTDSNFFLTRLFQSILKYFKSRSIKQMVHEGFLSNYNSIRHQIQEYLDSEGSGTSTVYITGHSLGGSVGALCSLDLTDSYSFKEVIFCSYGESRPGGGKFADLFNSRLDKNESYRVVNDRDIVCRIPPWEMGYRSHKTELFMDNDSNVFEETDNIGDYSKIEKQIESLHPKLENGDLTVLDIKEFAKDHERESYRKALEAIDEDKPIQRKQKIATLDPSV